MSEDKKIVIKPKMKKKKVKIAKLDLSNMKVSKIVIHPSRKINLGNYNNVELNAGIEITFDKPVSLDSKDLVNGFNLARAVIKKEFGLQWQPYKEMLEKKAEAKKKAKEEKKNG